jgi:sterol desaturase/sphingolipid hydroxylase (fatty acid hydroxylase superfamily)
MERYGEILLIAMPAFLLLVFFEKWYGWYKGKDTYHNMDMISSLSSGVSNVVKDVLGLSVSILTYDWMVSHVAIWHIESTFWTFFIAFIVLDFEGYWVHRIAHQVNFFWNKHAIHHSSEDFNLACALRQSVSSFVNLFTFFLLPAAMLGVPTEVIGIVAPLHLFAQFWYHTQHIGKMGILEKIIVTPSHHRVHHAINPEYMDKNISQIFIFWDKIFGTFQEELPDVPPVYGITRPAQTWNPITINFQHLWLLIKDAWRARSWWDKLRIWFMPTGWRPADVEAAYPVHKIEDVYHFERFQTPTSTTLNTWIWIQFAWTTILVFYFFGHLGDIAAADLLVYGGFIFLTIYSYSELMDGNPHALWWEILKSGLGLYWIWSSGDWFGISHTLSGAQYAIALYLVLSVGVTAYFTVRLQDRISFQGRFTK